jgi:prolyl 4-hydroxylase
LFIVLSIIACIPPILFIKYILSSSNNNKKTYEPYTIKEIPNFLTHDECDTLIKIASTQLTPSKVYNENSDDVMTDHRISDQCWLSDTDHNIVNKISTITSNICNKPKENQELLQVVKYSTGGFFNPHYDTCMGDDPDYCKRMNGKAGPRYGTLIVYLNDDFTGGETIFPNINKTVKPEKGKAVFFYTTDTNGNLLNESLHAGNPVISGNKWICNKWTRINKYTN